MPLLDAALIVFAKAPVPGAAKTRLIPALGAAGAAALHARLVRHCLRVARPLFEEITLWCAPDAAHPFFAECAAEFGVPLRAQDGVDLGARMAHALHTTLAQMPRALLIGTDCPVLNAPTFAEAVDALHANDGVFVPVEDGGYALVGARATALPLALWFAGVAWSTASVMQTTRERLTDQGQTWHECAALWDVDEPADLARLQAVLPSLLAP